MSGMVQVAVAGDVAEAEEMQEILRNAGIESLIEQAPEDDAVTVLVPKPSSRPRRTRSRPSPSPTI